LTQALGSRKQSVADIATFTVSLTLAHDVMAFTAVALFLLVTPFEGAWALTLASSSNESAPPLSHKRVATGASYVPPAGFTQLYKTSVNCVSPALPATAAEPTSLYANARLRAFSTMFDSTTPCFEAEYVLGPNGEITSKTLVNAYSSGLTDAPEELGDTFRYEQNPSSHTYLRSFFGSNTNAEHFGCAYLCNLCGSGCWVSYKNGGYAEMWVETSGGPTATGDPHMVNIKGQHFDILQRGNHVLVHIPRGAPPRDTLLRVEAVVAGGPSCDFSFIQSLNITGKWTEKDGKGGARPNGVRLEALPFGHKSKTRPRFDFGPVHFAAGYGRTESGFTYLNFRTSPLHLSNMSVGGLLGEDDHAAAASLENCLKDLRHSGNMSYADEVEAGSSTAAVA